MAKRILVADDEIHIVRAVALKLSNAGYEVVTAADGQEALDAIAQQSPDLVITDCQMPKVNGFELCQRLASNRSTCAIPVMMLTAKGFEFDEDEAKRELGIEAVVSKPFSPRELLALVKETLDRGPRTEERVNKWAPRPACGLAPEGPRTVRAGM